MKTTDSSGFYLFDSLKLGEYQLVISKEFFVSETLLLNLKSEERVIKDFYLNELDPDTSTKEFTDQEILTAAYSNSKYPPGFYTEELQGGNIYYVNTVSIKPVNEREHIWIQLCTDNRDEAFNWSELTCNYSSYYRDLIEEKETEKYFEFRRVYKENPNDVALFRAHKCAYLDRSMYDFFKKGPFIGIYNKKPYKLNEVKELIEYLWFTSNYNIGGVSILNSTTIETGKEFIHTLYEVSVTYGDWNSYDDISLWKLNYYINKSNGEITFSKSLLKTITGRLN